MRACDRAACGAVLTSVEEVEDEGDPSDGMIDLFSDVVPFVVEHGRQSDVDARRRGSGVGRCDQAQTALMDAALPKTCA